MPEWTTPSPRRSSAEPADDALSWSERLIAALIAPSLFFISILLAIAPLKLVFATSFLVSMVVPRALFWLVGIGSFIYGAIFGLSGLASLMGHAFLTHGEAERDLRKTAALWASVALPAIFIGLSN